MNIAVTARQIAELLQVPLSGSADLIVREIAAPAQACVGAIVFAESAASLQQAIASSASLILTTVEFGESYNDDRLLFVASPRLALARVYARWFHARGSNGVHPAAIVSPDALLGEDCEVGAGAVIEAGARVGAGCAIGPNVVIHGCCTLGDRVKVQAGAVLGSDGFGYVRDGAGYLPTPQIGILEIGDDVEIGASTTIDRGALGVTTIGRGCKIDNLCHIAHNCTLGENVLLAAQVGLAGSIKIGDGAMIGGQAGLGEGVTIGAGVILGGQAGVLPGKTIDVPGVVHFGTPAQPARHFFREQARLRKVSSWP